MHKTDGAILLLKNFSAGLTLPVFSLLLLNKGCTMAQLAAAVGAFSLTAMALELPTGIFADRFGRKNCFLLSQGIGCAATLLLLLSQGVGMVVASMALNGAARAFGSGSMDALLIDRELRQTGEAGLAKVSTQLSLLETVGVAAGSVAGGALSSFMQGITPQRPYDAALALRLLLTLCTGVLALWFTQETAPRNEKGATLTQYIKEGALLVKNSAVIRLLTVGGLLTGFFFGTVEVYWQPAFAGLLKNQSMLWLLGFISFGVQIFASLGSVAMQRLLHRERISNLAGYNGMRAALGLLLLLLSLANSAAGFVVWYLVLYFALGAANIAESVLFNLEVPNEHRAGMLSFSSLVVQGGNLLSSVAAGVAVLLYGVGALWFWGALALILISLAIAFLLAKAEKQRVLFSRDDAVHAEHGQNN